MKQKICYGISAVLLVLAVVFFFQGKDKKDNYYMSEYSTQSNVNAYVGGDAYNYIINGTYFSGYMALAAGAIISSALLFGTGLVVGTVENGTAALQAGMEDTKDSAE